MREHWIEWRSLLIIDLIVKCLLVVNLQLQMLQVIEVTNQASDKKEMIRPESKENR